MTDIIRFGELVAQGDKRAVIDLLFSSEEHQVVEYLHSLGVRVFSGSKKDIIDRNKITILKSCKGRAA